MMKGKGALGGVVEENVLNVCEVIKGRYLNMIIAI